jgi:hypothetical protein
LSLRLLLVRLAWSALQKDEVVRTPSPGAEIDRKYPAGFGILAERHGVLFAEILAPRIRVIGAGIRIGRQGSYISPHKYQ